MNLVPGGLLEPLEQRLLLAADAITGAEPLAWAPQQAETDHGVLTGLVWQDSNGNDNGRIDDAERGLPGVTIYTDLNDNRMLDRFEPNTRSAQDDPQTGNDEAGRYRLELPAGRYVVRQVVPDVFDQTRPADAGAYEVRLEASAVVDRLDFGNQLRRRGAVHGRK